MNFIKHTSIISSVVIVILYTYFGILENVHDTISTIIRISVLPAVGWFSYKIFVTFFSESMHEKNHHGAIPILAFCYTLVSSYFFYQFSDTFDVIVSSTVNKVYGNLSSTDNKIFYINTTKILMSSALIAFSFQVMKANFTLNSLELGLIYNTNLRVVLSEKRYGALAEAVARLLVAIAFMFLEYQLNAPPTEKVNEPINSSALTFQDPESIILSSVGMTTIALSLLLLSWLMIIMYLDRLKNLPKNWYVNSSWQFSFGLPLGLVLLLLDHPSKEVLLISLIVGVGSCLLLIYFIIKGEVISYKHGTRNNI